jgi:hypothetical protein
VIRKFVFRWVIRRRGLKPLASASGGEDGCYARGFKPLLPIDLLAFDFDNFAHTHISCGGGGNLGGTHWPFLASLLRKMGEYFPHRPKLCDPLPDLRASAFRLSEINSPATAKGWAEAKRIGYEIANWRAEKRFETPSRQERQGLRPEKQSPSLPKSSQVFPCLPLSCLAAWQ